jgi:hypothetical protein
MLSGVSAGLTNVSVSLKDTVVTDGLNIVFILFSRFIYELLLLDMLSVRIVLRPIISVAVSAFLGGFTIGFHVGKLNPLEEKLYSEVCPVRAKHAGDSVIGVYKRKHRITGINCCYRQIDRKCSLTSKKCIVKY